MINREEYSVHDNGEIIVISLLKKKKTDFSIRLEFL
jgi:hypothetical protein